MFVDGSYAGLWQADTDPPTGVIENKFQLGKNSEQALPASKQELIFSCYETTPTISELDIYYETSTAFDIYSLNEQFSSGLIIEEEEEETTEEATEEETEETTEESAEETTEESTEETSGKPESGDPAS